MSEFSSTDIIERETHKIQVLPAIRQPRKYRVLLLNDDYTPMNFVVEVLIRFFHFNNEKAVQIMLQIHTTGKSICGVFTQEIAETKVVQVNQYARNHEHPLLCTMEPE